MEDKKKVIILVTIALILAATAIALNVMDSEEVPTTAPTIDQGEPTGAEVGIAIEPSPVEDKLTETPQQ